MVDARPRYLSTLSFDDTWLDELRARVPAVEIMQVRADKCDDVPAELWQGVDILHTSGAIPDPAVAPRLRWVQLDTSGVDHVRGTALWSSDIELTTIGGVSPVPLAEYVLFAILGTAHRLTALLDVRATREWPSAQGRWERFLPAPIVGSTVGIVGYGRIGREVGRLARAHGMNVIGMNRAGRRHDDERRATQIDFGRTVDESGVEIVGPAELHHLLAESDYVVVVVPLTDETSNLVDADALAMMKPGAVLINVARGGIVDETALLPALRSGRIGGAVLDVFDDEPLPPDSVWWGEPNVVVTPHVAGLAPSYSEQVLEIVATNLRRFVDGESLLNRVDRARGY